MDPALLMAVVYGVAIGIALGLTGGGGSIFAVPLLIYGLGVGVREAVGISLAAVGSTAALGAFHRWRAGQLELRTGLLFAAAGMLGAPLGTRLGALIPPATTLSIFALLMIVVGIRMWRLARAERPNPTRSSTCQRHEDGLLRWSSPCILVLSLAGLLTGLLSGLFGVGGGFLIVPALLFTSGMPIRHAVGTSLLVITLICLSGVTSYLATGGQLPPTLTILFVLGGFAGMLGGSKLAQRLNAPALTRLFAIAIWLVASFVLAHNLPW